MPWNQELANHAIQFLNQNHPPDPWTCSLKKRTVYFFRKTWWERHRLGRRAFPAYHWFASTYKWPHPRYASPHQIVCAARLEVDLIPKYTLQVPIPQNVLAMFQNAPKIRVAGQPLYEIRVKDIGTFRTVDETYDDAWKSYLNLVAPKRTQFDPEILTNGLPYDVWQQIQCFFLRSPIVGPFLNLP